ISVMDATTGLVNISSTGAITNSTIGGGTLLQVTGNGSITPTLASISNTSAMTGNGRLLDLTADNATTPTGLFAISAINMTTGTAMKVTASNANTSDFSIAGGFAPIMFSTTFAQAGTAQSTASGYAGLRLNYTHNPTVTGNTENMMVIQNQVTSNATDLAVNAGLLIDNADTSASNSTILTDALRITNSGGIAIGITNAINIASTDVVTDILMQNGETIDNNVNGQINLNTGVAGANDGIWIDSGQTTSTAFGLCHSGADADNAAFSDRQIVACAGAVDGDYAEKYPVAAGITYGDIVAPGTKEVVTTQGQKIVELVMTTEPYQGPVAGIVAKNYGDFTSAGNNIKKEDNPMPVSLVGRVPVNVTNENGAIAVGDFITTSSTAGKGMKATEAGRVIGMALSTFDAVEGQVMVQIVNTWYQPSSSSSLQGGNNTGDMLSMGAIDAENLTVTGQLYVGSDIAGRARIKAGDESVHVTFETEYSYQPIVIASVREDIDSAFAWWIENETTTGFDIVRSAFSDSAVEFNWIAMGVDGGIVSISDGTTEEITITVADPGASTDIIGVVADTGSSSVPVEEPAVEAPAEEPVAEEPAVEAPAEEPVAEEPVVEAPAEEPVAEEPVAEEPAVEAPADSAPVSE
ncbi:MAG: hypothetical protein AAB337_01135, partial [Patescibacteria group bacterium]